jgi:diketogulonate reductase-like aldo/keto reductase
MACEQLRLRCAESLENVFREVTVAYFDLLNRHWREWENHETRKLDNAISEPRFESDATQHE